MVMDESRKRNRHRQNYSHRPLTTPSTVSLSTIIQSTKHSKIQQPGGWAETATL